MRPSEQEGNMALDRPGLMILEEEDHWECWLLEGSL